MKFWFEAQLEKGDESKQCCKCRVWVSEPDIIFVENVMRSGGLPHPDEIHPDPTGKFMCSACGRMVLV